MSGWQPAVDPSFSKLAPDTGILQLTPGEPGETRVFAKADEIARKNSAPSEDTLLAAVI
jgi:hypothetical protein